MNPCSVAVAFLALATLGSIALADENWPQWRGPDGNGVSNAANLPTKWSDTENVIWKIDVPAFASSSPVIWGNRLFLISPEQGEKIEPPTTGSVDDPAPDFTRGGQAAAGGARPGFGPGTGGRGSIPGVRLPGERVGANPGGSGIDLWCVDKETGEVLWKRRFTEGNFQGRKGNMANPSPVVDAERVYAMAGTGALVAYDFAGRELWKRDIQTDTAPFALSYGYASSPLPYQDRLIVAVVHKTRTEEPAAMLAISKATGEVLWKTPRLTKARGESADCYGTPQLLVRGGRTEVLMQGGDLLTAHDPMTGNELWRIEELYPKNLNTYRVVPSVTVAPNGLIIVPTKEQPVWTFDANDRDAEGRPKELWKSEWGPDVASPVSDGQNLWLYAKDNLGILACHDARTGKLQYERRRLEAGGYHTASLLLADGKIYALNENSETTVLEASPEYKVLARNLLDSAYTISSIAISGHRLYIRTGDHLYCIGEVGN